LTTTLNSKANSESPTFTGTVSLPSSTNVKIGNSTLDSFIQSVTGTSSINITGVQLSDSFIVQTNNTSGNIQAHVSLANDINELASQIQKTTPWFSNNTTVRANGVGWDTNGWIISARLNNSTAYNAMNGTARWQSSAAAGSANGATDVNEWIQVKFPTPVKISSYQWTNAGGASLGFPGTWTLQYSDDGTNNFTIAGSYSKSGWIETGVTETYYVAPNHPPALYWRLRITKTRQWECHISGLVFTTAGYFGAPKSWSAIPLSISNFKIVLVDANNEPITMNTTEAIWKFNIMITKAGQIVCSGLYQITRSGSNGVLVKLS
jgi:hypothetical protein